MFLLGMTVMTSGLHDLAGHNLRRGLLHYTRSPLTGAATGTGFTALLQSSSATTVATVGFVNAELMSFHNALGIIFGANLGTTITGWLVALIGFKLKIGLLALPLIFIGSLLKLFARDKLAATGFSLAGFGLIFIGVSYLQDGMLVLRDLFDFSQLPADNISGLLQLVGIGVLFTVVTQSSSMGVATALSALFAGIIGWQQAAALVIGMDIGTTVTAALATIGASDSARRTGLSHVIYNLLTAVMALLLITPFTAFSDWLNPELRVNDPELMLVAFHSSFNLIGVILILPFARQFAHLICFLIPEKHSAFTDKLDSSLLNTPEQALNTVRQVALSEFITLLNYIDNFLVKGTTDHNQLSQLQKALNETHHFLDEIPTCNSAQLSQLKAQFELLDHLQRLHERCEEEEDRAITLRDTVNLDRFRAPFLASVPTIREALKQRSWSLAAQQAADLQRDTQRQVLPLREHVTYLMAQGELDVTEGTSQLESIRWLNRVTNHIQRCCHALEISVVGSPDRATTL